MRYLILILTLLFSFNLKAESYVCAYDNNGVIQQNVFYRDGDVFKQDYEFGETSTFDVYESDYNDLIVLNSIGLFGGQYFTNITHAINKKTLQYIYSSYANLISESTPLLYKGTCRLIP